MSLKDLKAAIISEDWDGVRAAYENMTGESIGPIQPIPQVQTDKKPAKKTAKKATIKKAAKFTESDKKSAKKTAKKTAKKATIKKAAKFTESDKKGFVLHEDNIERTNKPKFVRNLFEDYGDDPVPITAEEAATLKKMNANRVVRPSDEIEARCSGCGEIKKVRSILVAGKSMGSKFRCDKCIG